MRGLLVSERAVETAARFCAAPSRESASGVSACGVSACGVSACGVSACGVSSLSLGAGGVLPTIMESGGSAVGAADESAGGSGGGGGGGGGKGGEGKLTAAAERKSRVQFDQPSGGLPGSSGPPSGLPGLSSGPSEEHGVLHIGFCVNEVPWGTASPSEVSVRAVQQVVLLGIPGDLLREIATAHPEIDDALWLAVCYAVRRSNPCPTCSKLLLANKLLHSAAMLLLPCFCCHAPAAMLLLPCFCRHASAAIERIRQQGPKALDPPTPTLTLAPIPHPNPNPQPQTSPPTLTHHPTPSTGWDVSDQAAHPPPRRRE